MMCPSLKLSNSVQRLNAFANPFWNFEKINFNLKNGGKFKLMNIKTCFSKIKNFCLRYHFTFITIVTW